MSGVDSSVISWEEVRVSATTYTLGLSWEACRISQVSNSSHLSEFEHLQRQKGVDEVVGVAVTMPSGWS